MSYLHQIFILQPLHEMADNYFTFRCRNCVVKYEGMVINFMRVIDSSTNLGYKDINPEALIFL